MNILLTSMSPAEIAKHHCDTHLRSMIVEAGQIVSTVIRLKMGTPGTLLKRTGPEKKIITEEYDYVLHTLGEDGDFPIVHKVTKPETALVQWALRTSGNYDFVLNVLKCMNLEHFHRFARTHETARILAVSDMVFSRLDAGPQEPFPEALIPYHWDDPVAAYREYVQSRYRTWAGRNEHRRRKFRVRWTNRQTPDFIDAGTRQIIEDAC